MKKRTTVQFICLFMICASIFMACRKNQLFEGFKQEYGLKADSIRSFSGNNRLQIRIAIPHQDIVTAKLFWNDRKDFKDVPVTHLTKWPDTVSTIIGPLEEGDYNFEILTYDVNGKASIPVKITGTALGEKYEATLSNREITAVYYDNNEAVIYWGTADSELFTEVSYTDDNDVVQRKQVPYAKDTTKLVNFKPSDDLSTTVTYRTVYKPDLAIDTFYAHSKTETVITATLGQLASANNIYFGSLISYGGGGITHGIAFDNSPNGIYTELCKGEFNVGQATWGPGRWSKDSPSNFNDVNAVINWSHGQYNKVMTMLITGPDNYMPAWFTGGTFTPTEMDDMLKELVEEIMTVNDNKSKVDVWNVANELFNNDGTYRNMKWNDMGWEDDESGLTGTNKINLKHPAFVGKAFQYCREQTDALLELRDYGIENDDPNDRYYTKYKAFYQLIEHLKATNRPIDVVGIQAHMIIGRAIAVGTAENMRGEIPPVSYDGFKKAIQKYKDAGMDVYLTELDIVSPMPDGQLQPWTPALAEQQRKDYYNVVKTAIDAGVQFISLWGLRDNNDPGWRVGQSPLLFDENYNKKPAYYGVQKAFFEAINRP